MGKKKKSSKQDEEILGSEEVENMLDQEDAAVEASPEVVSKVHSKPKKSSSKVQVHSKFAKFNKKSKGAK
jgi:hypothetical protein